jgi:hypothetical protein
MAPEKNRMKAKHIPQTKAYQQIIAAFQFMKPQKMD